jgi:hypothetical protein
MLSFFKKKISVKEISKMMTIFVIEYIIKLTEELYPGKIEKSENFITKEIKIEKWLEIYAAILFPFNIALKTTFDDINRTQRVAQWVFDYVTTLIADKFGDEEAKEFSRKLLNKIEEYLIIFETEKTKNRIITKNDKVKIRALSLSTLSFHICKNLGFSVKEDKISDDCIFNYSMFYFMAFPRIIGNMESNYKITD